MSTTHTAARQVADGTWIPTLYTEDGPESLTGGYATEAEAVAAADRYLADDAADDQAWDFTFDGVPDEDFED